MRRGYPRQGPRDPITVGPIQPPGQQGPPIRFPGPPTDPRANLPGLPLDPIMEGGRRQLEDELTAALTRFAGQRGQIGSLAELIRTRLGTDEGRERDLADEGYAGRGIYSSGVRGQGLQKIGGAYDRERQNLAFDTARQFGDLSGQESEARLGYTRGLQELLADLARRTAENPNAPMGPTPRPQPNRNRRKGQGKRRQRGRPQPGPPIRMPFGGI